MCVGSVSNQVALRRARLWQPDGAQQDLRVTVPTPQPKRTAAPILTKDSQPMRFETKPTIGARQAVPA